MRDYCAKQIFHQHFLKEKTRETTIKQLRGIYFENHVLGGERFSLPGHKKTGEPLISTIRINEQIKQFRDVCVDNLLFVHEKVNTQIPLIKRYNEKYLLKGVLDWFPTFLLYEGDVRVAIIDLKLTENIDNDFGDFGWGNYENMDWLQGALYHHLVHDIDWSLNGHLSPVQQRFIRRFDNILNKEEELFMYLVFDYQQNTQHRFFESVWDYDKLKYVENQVERTILEVEHNDLKGWQPMPGESCKTCLLDCPARTLIQKQ